MADRSVPADALPAGYSITDELVRAAREDMAALEELARRLLILTWRISWRERNFIAREDFRQDVCERTIKGLRQGKIDTARDLVNYLYAVARNLRADRYRRWHRWGRDESLDQLRGVGFEPGNGHRACRRIEGSVECEELLLRLERLRRVDDIMAEILVGRFVYDESREELALRLGVSLRTIDRKTNQGIARLLRMYGAHAGGRSS
ncbi:sigma-70 family RNA polymerase sigma factor [bacterium]|nr:sigma-70 family RNA polymerase sigma factor [candidate division CSSED10-310 bacterium]